VFDRLALTNTPGSLRLVYNALKNFSEYARAKGLMDGALAVRPPAKNPQKPITVYTPEEVSALMSAARGRSRKWNEPPSMDTRFPLDLVSWIAWSQCGHVIAVRGIV
jgi:hypothetical protein